MTAIKKQYPVFDKHPQLVYLDSAATTLRPQPVIQAIADFMAYENANIHRGAYDLSLRATEAYETVRNKVADFIDAPDASHIGFTKGTTEAINVVAHSLFTQQPAQPDDNIVVSLMEHHANFLPWQRIAELQGIKLRIIPVDQEGNLVMDKLDDLIDNQTRIVAVNHISNTLGTINDIAHIIQHCHQKGVPVMVDAAQSASLYPISAKELDYDFLTFSAHKLFGPFGTGILYVRGDFRDKIHPLSVGGGMVKHVAIDKTVYYGFPQNLDAGTPNVDGVIGMGAAIDFIRSIDQAAERERLHALTTYALDQLRDVPGLKIFGRPVNRSGIISFYFDDIHPHDMASFLNKDQIAVRSGMHCTHPLLDAFEIPATVRASFSIYNTEEDVASLVKSLKEIQKIWA